MYIRRPTSFIQYWFVIPIAVVLNKNTAVPGKITRLSLFSQATKIVTHVGSEGIRGLAVVATSTVALIASVIIVVVVFSVLGAAGGLRIPLFIFIHPVVTWSFSCSSRVAVFFCLTSSLASSQIWPVQGWRVTGLTAKSQDGEGWPLPSRQITFRCCRPWPHFTLHWKKGPRMRWRRLSFFCCVTYAKVG